jgi:hypothetical protein
MNGDAVRVNHLDLRAAFPSLRIMETLKLAFSIPCLVASGIGVTIGSFVYSESIKGLPESFGGSGRFPLPVAIRSALQDVTTILTLASSAGWLCFFRLIVTFVLLGFTGIAISKTAGVRFCKDQRIGAIRSLVVAAKSWRAGFASTLLTCLIASAGLLAFRIQCVVTRMASGSIMEQCADIALWLTAILTIVLLAVLGTGWLLSLSAVGIDSCDGPEALSRGISYVLSQLTRTVCYAAIIFAGVALSSYAMQILLLQAEHLADRSLHDGLVSLRPASQTFNQFCWFVLETWQTSFIGSGIAVCYVLLRRFEDGTDMATMDCGQPSAVA